jgi:hypothetical protein
MATVMSGAGRGLAPLLILLSCIVAVLAGPSSREGSNAWAQPDASPQSAFRLVGTIEGGPITGAVIDDTKNPQAFYRLNEKLPDESQIVKVRSDYIVLKWPDGTRTELYVTPGTGGGTGRVAAAATPFASARRVDQPAPSGQDAARRRPPRMDRQLPNQQGAQVPDPNAKTGSGGGNRNKSRPNNRN